MCQELPPTDWCNCVRLHKPSSINGLFPLLNTRHFLLSPYTHTVLKLLLTICQKRGSLTHHRKEILNKLLPWWSWRYLEESNLLSMRSVVNWPSIRVTCVFYKGFPGGSDGKESTCNAGDRGSIPGSGRSPAEGNGNPLQYSCLENPMDREAWWAPVHGVAKSQTWLSN